MAILIIAAVAAFAVLIILGRANRILRNSRVKLFGVQAWDTRPRK